MHANLATSLVLAGLLCAPIMAQAHSAFDDALAACARTTEACDKASYDETLCDAARKALPDCDANTGSGGLCKIKLADIAPTQVAVGAHAAHCKAKAKFKKSKDKIQHYLLRSNHHLPVVIGPKNGADKRFYITDHHHLSYALWYANEQGYTDVDTLYACILTNLKADDSDDFWSYMVSHRLTWLDDENGQAISPKTLETRAADLEDMADDPYRTWSRWVRDSCGYVKAGNDCVPASYPAGAAYFMEFLWADYLQRNLPGEDDIGAMSDKQIASTIEEAIAIAQAPQAFLEGLPGYNDGSVLKPKPVDITEGCEAD